MPSTRAKLARRRHTGKRQQVCEVTEELLTLNNGDSMQAYCNLNVNGRSVRLMLDCGLTVNVLRLSNASSIDPQLTTLTPTDARLCASNDVRWH